MSNSKESYRNVLSQYQRAKDLLHALRQQLATFAKSTREQEEEQIEPMSIESLDRLCLEPIQHSKIFDNYLKQMSRNWTFDELDTSSDFKDFMTLNENERRYILMILAFFANSDNAIMENIQRRLREEIHWPEAQLALAKQAEMEGVHVVTYNRMIRAVVEGEENRKELFHAVKTNPYIAKKIEWARKWASDYTIPLHQVLVAQCLSEGIGFASSFAGLMWLRIQRKCNGITFGNKKIMDDEALHVDLSSLLSFECDYPVSEQTILDMCAELVEIECEFVREALPFNLKGMNKELMIQFVKYTADQILTQLKVKTMLYKTANPFSWMDSLQTIGRENFFEVTAGMYQMATNETAITTTKFSDLGSEIDF